MRFVEYLTEAKENHIASRQGKSLVNVATQRRDGERIDGWPEWGSEWTPELIDKWGLYLVKEIKKADVQNKYLQWLVNMYLNEAFLLEDIPRVHAAVQGWHQVKSKMDNKDIGQFKHINDLEDAVEAAQQADTGELTKSQRQKLTTAVPVRKQDYGNVIMHGKDGVLIHTKTQEENDYYAEGTSWCTRTAYGSPQFDYYAKDGPIFIFLGADGRRFQFHFESKQFMDERDRGVNLAQLRETYPTIAEYFAWRGRNATKDPQTAYSYAITDLNRERFPGGEDAILTDPEVAALYAKNIIRGPWPEAEELLLTRPDVAIDYLLDTRKTPWPEAEQYFTQNADSAYKYASQIQDGAWPPGEAAIATDATLSLAYAKEVIKQPWPPGEAAIATNAKTSFDYAVDVLGRKRFPAGEAAILRHVDEKGNDSPDVAVNYADRVIGGRWPEAEPWIAKDDWSSIWYQSSVWSDFNPNAYNELEPA